jgi:pyrimidine oxygenase
MTAAPTDEPSYLRTGLFLPVANHGWVMSMSAPTDPATFALNVGLTKRAEAMGMDMVLCQSVWRGHGGPSRFWEDSLEGFTTAAALAGATSRIAVVPSVMPLLYPPAVVAKMMATLDEISAGRVAMNVVVGANLAEYEQMGILPDDWPRVKYDYAAEWLTVVKRLWSEERVTHHGQWFDLDDCACGPKPIQQPSPAVLCAGSSPAGMAFTSRHATHGFVGAPSAAATAALAQAYKGEAASVGRDLEVHTVMMLVLAPTLAESEDRIAALEAEPDLVAVRDCHGEYSREVAGASLRRDAADKPPVWFGKRPDPITPELLADQLQEMHEGGVDGVLLSAAGWDADLDVVERQVLPELRRRGVIAPLPGRPWGYRGQRAAVAAR